MEYSQKFLSSARGKDLKAKFHEIYPKSFELFFGSSSILMCACISFSHRVSVLRQLCYFIPMIFLLTICFVSSILSKEMEKKEEKFNSKTYLVILRFI